MNCIALFKKRDRPVSAAVVPLKKTFGTLFFFDADTKSKLVKHL